MFNIKKIIKWFFIILGILLFLLIGFFILTEMNIIKLPELPKKEIPSIKETKFENIEEWYDDKQKCTMFKAKYTFDGLNGIGYYEQQKLKAEQLFRERESLEKQAKEKNLQIYLNDKAIDVNRSPNNPELDNLSEKIMKNHNELIKINQKLILYRLETQKEPSNLANYIKDRYPFDRWNSEGLTYEETSINEFEYSSFDMQDDSHLYSNINFENQFKENSSGNCLILKYKGPKHFLDDNKDYYLGRAHVSNSNFKLTNFNLHFNPVRKTLSLYQDKHNNDKAKEAEYNKRTSDDW
ncbi:MAG: AYWB SAP53-like protein [Candidatus Phytoplasma solani]